MKLPQIILIIAIIFFACQKTEIKYKESIINNNRINTKFLHKIDEPEKALISAYLYAYGNECTDTSTNVKAQVLKVLNISGECDTNNINFLRRWFKSDALFSYKLKKCPILPYNSPIQNEIKQLELYRHNDTIRITIAVQGVNNSQEKTWNIKQTETYVVKNKELIKVR